MGRVVAFPTARTGVRPRRTRRQPWDVSLLVADGAMRAPNGAIVRCHGRVLARLHDDGSWEFAWRDGETGLTETIEGDERTTARSVTERMWLRMFGLLPGTRQEAAFGAFMVVLGLL